MPICGIRIGTVCVNAQRHDRAIDGASVRNAGTSRGRKMSPLGGMDQIAIAAMIYRHDLS